MYRIKATVGVRPRARSIRLSAVYLALFFVVASVSQLFAFEDFPAVIASYGISIEAALILAAVIVTLEVFALPFLLFMKVSPLMRLVSLFSGAAALCFWLVVGVWQNLSPDEIQNAGLFGSMINVPQGWWLVTYMTALIILFIFTVWAVQPRFHQSSKSRKRKVK